MYVHSLFVLLTGVELIAAFQANDRGKSISVERVNVVDSSGTILVSCQDIFTLGNNAFAIIHLQFYSTGKLWGSLRESTTSHT